VHGSFGTATGPNRDPTPSAHVGPSCANPPHQPCNPAPRHRNRHAGQECDNASARASATSVGRPLAARRARIARTDVKKRCNEPGNCVWSSHASPRHTGHHCRCRPAASSVCVVNTFTEDVTGTTDLATGAGVIYGWRQNVATLGGGGHPAALPGVWRLLLGARTDPAIRTLCTRTTLRWTGQHVRHSRSAATGPDADLALSRQYALRRSDRVLRQPERRLSVEWPLSSASSTSSSIRRRRALTSFTANENCEQTLRLQRQEVHRRPNKHHTCTVDGDCTGSACEGGANTWSSCTAASECPARLRRRRTCNFQCWCRRSATTTQKPNACATACLGGPGRRQPCTTTTECTPPGFCHVGDCRSESVRHRLLRRGTLHRRARSTRSAPGKRGSRARSDLECQATRPRPGRFVFILA
jgi:hypothetical protein